jgi:hypothetical protein
VSIADKLRKTTMHQSNLPSPEAVPPPDAFRRAGAPRPGPEREPRPGWHVVVRSAALPQLFDARPGAGFGPGPGDAAAMDLIHQRGANAFFAAVRQTVAVGDVIHVAEPPLASLIAGVTGRWTTSGILRDVRSSAPASPPDQCDYLVLAREMGGPPGPPMPGRERPQRFRPDPPPGFEKVFANEFGSLWRNPSPPEHLRAPAPAVLSLPRLAGLAAVALGLVVVDLLRRPSRTARWLVPLLGALMVAVCLWPLVQTAARELTHPPTPPPRPELPGLTMDDDAIRRQHERVLQAVEQWVNDGRDPDAFWPPEAEERLHSLMQQGRIREARDLLENALRALSGAPSHHR